MANTSSEPTRSDPGLPTAQRRLFVVAGEPSGDRLGAALVDELGQRLSLSVRGVGGTALRQTGLVPLFDMTELSVMGFVDVFFALPRLLFRLDQVVRAAMGFRPDVIVFVDNQVFSALAAKRLRRAGYSGPLFLYVAPSVWAWKPERARKLAPLFDEVLAVLPFEPEVMRELGGPPTVFVGHPAETLIDAERQPPLRGLLALLPGSRKGELDRHLPLFRRVVERLAGHEAIEGFVLPTLAHLQPRLAAETAAWPVPVAVIAGEAARRQAFTHAVAALAGAGTITLELAMMGVPTVGTYIPDFLQMRAYRRWGKPLVGLPNIVLGDEVVPEIAPGRDQAERVAAALRDLLDRPEARERQYRGFAEVRDRIVNGLPGIGRTSAAERVMARLVPEGG